MTCRPARPTQLTKVVHTKRRAINLPQAIRLPASLKVFVRIRQNSATDFWEKIARSENFFPLVPFNAESARYMTPLS
jgi:hypothetical protein